MFGGRTRVGPHTGKAKLQLKADYKTANRFIMSYDCSKIEQIYLIQTSVKTRTPTIRSKNKTFSLFGRLVGASRAGPTSFFALARSAPRRSTVQRFFKELKIFWFDERTLTPPAFPKPDRSFTILPRFFRFFPPRISELTTTDDDADSVVRLSSFYSYYFFELELIYYFSHTNQCAFIVPLPVTVII